MTRWSSRRSVCPGNHLPGRSASTASSPRRASDQAQVRADSERAILSSQEANQKFAAPAASRDAPKIAHAPETSESIKAPRPAETIPPPMRTPAQARRWRYSHGERLCVACRIAEEMPTTRSDLSQWCCHWVRSSGCLLSVVAGGRRPGGSSQGASRCAVLSPGRTAAAGWRRPTASRTAPWGTAHPAISVSAETSQNERIVNVPSSPRPAHHHRSGQGRAGRHREGSGEAESVHPPVRRHQEREPRAGGKGPGSITIQAGSHTITAADPLTDELRQALEAINGTG